MKNTDTYLSNLLAPWKLRLYFLQNLPSAWWWGLRVKNAGRHATQVVIPYSWRTKNPFRSIYFAALCGAGELSTGILANLARLESGNISMLVLSQQARFLKKATGQITFTCEDGPKVFEAVRRAVATGEAQAVPMLGIGRNTTGDVVAEVEITWTFKVRAKVQQ